ncbi:MAG: hypothetical protein GXY55_09170 [Phycisphaerae bacterium]|nr:hypothetical protein [Phycisphaerae bacterium]
MDAMLSICTAAVPFLQVMLALGSVEGVGPREFRSPQGHYMVRVTPIEAWPDHPGRCEAELFRVDQEHTHLVWSRSLINNHAPVSVYVSDSGEYVVTMDEWGSFGELPLVIYGKKGYLLMVHNLDSLGITKDCRQVRFSTAGLWWKEGALVFWGPSERSLVIRLHWGMVVAVRLRDGHLLDPRGFKDLEQVDWDAFVRNRGAQEVLTLLRSEDALEIEAGVIHAGGLGVMESRPILEKLETSSTAYYVELVPYPKRVFFLRERARKALALLDAPATQPSSRQEGNRHQEPSGVRRPPDQP